MSKTSPLAKTPTPEIRHPLPFDRAQQASAADTFDYISASWDHLTRRLTDCVTYADPKVENAPILYLPIEEEIPLAVKNLERQCNVRVEHLPQKISKAGDVDLRRIGSEGLLYLPYPYVVPGGQFNEMYGWDSYFIILGLLRNQRVDLAKGMVENFFYEIEHYGGVLNANRTYYLTRSQPPFLSSMILAVYDAQKAAGNADSQWLERAYRLAKTDYVQWTQAPHLAGDTGLSRYFDHGEGPVPEIMGDPDDYYRGVVQYLLLHYGAKSPYLIHVDSEHPSARVLGRVFQVSMCDEGPADSRNRGQQDCSHMDWFALTPDFYKGDRSMRESGFDVTFRFGDFGAKTHHYAPVCLNSLLYKTEKDLESMAALLGHPQDARTWNQKALDRQHNIDKYLWDAGRGRFYDYDFEAKSRSTYDYLTTFYPLWAGLASPQQARAVIDNLKLFVQPGGLVTSRFDSGTQWDYPYGWAPLQLLAVGGMRRYGDANDADRVASEFLQLIIKNYRYDRTIREKYDVVNGSEETHIAEGYRQNFVGFGWTNGVFLELWNQLPTVRTSQWLKE